MTTPLRLLPLLLAATVLASSAAVLQAQAPAAPKAELLTVKKIWDQGQHNAFTDLIRFDNLFYCCFREAAASVGGEGKIRILTSFDAATWASVALVASPGVDLRDPKLGITKDKRMILFMSGALYKGTTLESRQPRVCTSTDGRNWSPPEKSLSDGDNLWRSVWHEGEAKFYGTVFNDHPNTAGPKPEAEWTEKLFTSNDGKVWALSAIWDIKGQPNEATVRLLPSGDMAALVRREAGDKTSLIGMAKAPYREWTWASSGVLVQGPNFIALPDGRLIATGRGRGTTPGAHTMLYAMTASSLTPILELPSGGDCSYPGMVFHEGLLHLSYYSSHEGKTAIYFAKVRVP